MNFLQNKLDELLALRSRGPRPLSDCELCLAHGRELFRRELLWTQLLEATDNFPCADIAGILTNQSIPQPITDKLRHSFLPTSSAKVKVCKNYLRWQYLIHTDPGVIASFDLADPYEPLIPLLKAGGEFSIEHRWFLDIRPCGGINLLQLWHDTIGSAP